MTPLGTRVFLSSLAVLIGVASGCAGGGSTTRDQPPTSKPDSGVGFVQPKQTPAQAQAAAAETRRQWLDQINLRGQRGRTHPHPMRFASPGRASFLASLRKASKRYRFDVAEVRFYHPLQLAPFVIVRSAAPKTFSRDTAAVEGLLDPHILPGATDRNGWAYEGFYLEARDSKGIPFLAVFNYFRGASAGGGQWARSESLYPFQHG
jgi:hypothetical protein